MSQILLINRFRTNGADALSKQEKADLILAAKDAYYNAGAAILTDAEYDLLEDAAKAEGVAIGIGAEVTGGVRLPYMAPSLDKIKTEKDLSKWLKRYKGAADKVYVSCKLDGCSLLIWRDDTGHMHLYTRGDGVEGKDVTRILPHLKRLGRMEPGTCIRGELIMTKKLFAAKYATKYANIRNMIAGALARKTSVDVGLIGELDFVAYEVIALGGAGAIPVEAQFSYLSGGNWLTVWNESLSLSAVTMETLSNLLADKRENYAYEIDGLVCVANGVFPRPTKKDENPDYAFAFKMDMGEQTAKVTVTGVTWAISKDGYIKPSINYEPVPLSGVTCRNATGINAAFIKKGGIGVGAVVEVIRSGAVIPKVLRVISPATVTAMPTEVAAHWTYNNKGEEVDLVVDTVEENVEIIARNMLHFFTKLEVDGIKEGVIAKLIAAGFNSVTAVLAMTKADWLSIDGVQNTSATKYLAAIEKKVGGAGLLAVMAASNFGRGLGERKLGPIMAAYPQALFIPPTQEQLTAIDGVGPETAKAFLAGIAPFIEFVNKSPILLAKLEAGSTKVAAGVAAVADGTQKKTIVMSGFRDKEFAAWCAANGVDVADSVTKNTTALIVKNKGEITGKVEKAQKYGVAVMTMAEFKTMVLN